MNVNVFFIIFFLSSSETDSLTLEYGFENQPHIYCHSFPFNTSDRHIILKDAAGIILWNQINHGNYTDFSITPYLTASYENRSMHLCFRNLSRTNIGKLTLEEVSTSRQIDFYINVYYGPTELLLEPKLEPILRLNEHSDLTINCSAECNPDCQIKWWKDKNELSFPVFHQLVLTNLSKTDGGNYTCVAKNPKRKSYIMSKSVQMYIKYRPKINVLPDRIVKVDEYGDVNISCDVESYPPSKISWLGYGKQLNTIESMKNKVILYLLNNTCDETGMYECSAFNGVGTAVSKVIRLEVQCKPRFIGYYSGYTIAKKIKASIGDELTIKVKIQANPLPTVKFNSPDVDVTFVNISDTMVGVSIKTFISSDSDFRWYSAIIGNSKGSVAITLEVGRKVNSYQIIIGILVFVVFVSSSLIIYQIVKRKKQRKEKQIICDSVPYVNTDFEPDDLNAITDYSFDDGYLYQNRIREIELEATESYEDLSITADKSSYEEISAKADLNKEALSRRERQSESKSHRSKINCDIRKGSDGYLVITGLKAAGVLYDRERCHSEESLKEDGFKNDAEGYLNMNVLEAEVENKFDIKHRDICKKERRCSSW